MAKYKEILPSKDPHALHPSKPFAQKSPRIPLYHPAVNNSKKPFDESPNSFSQSIQKLKITHWLFFCSVFLLSICFISIGLVLGQALAAGRFNSHIGKALVQSAKKLGRKDVLKIHQITGSRRKALQDNIFNRKNAFELNIDNWSERRRNTLQMARLKIEEGSELNRDEDGLNEKLYHNLTKFRKSIKLMRQMLRIFVYKDGYRPLVHLGPKTGIYASEGMFMELMEQGNEFTVEDPDQATLFFLPFSLRQMVSYLYDSNLHSMKALKIYIANYVNALASNHPYWNRSKGSDHFFVACHDWALKVAEDHEELQKNSIKVVCNADPTWGFNISKDVSLPETRLRAPTADPKAKINTKLPGSQDRPYLAFFAGQMHGSVRPILLKYWGNGTDPGMKIYSKLPDSIERNVSYYEHMEMSKFCICAAGYEVNSPRLVESIMSECVPVIIADNFVLPFGDVIDWSAIAVRVPEAEIPNLKSILLEIGEEKYAEMQSLLKYVKRHFLWHPSPQSFDIFTMILHSIWTKILHL